MSEKMKDLGVRTASGLILGIVMLGAIYWSIWSFGALLVVLVAVGMSEFYALTEKQGFFP